MKDLNAYTEEVHRRVEVQSRTLDQQRRRTLAICLPLAACVALGALFLPAALRRDRQVQPDRAGQNQITGQFLTTVERIVPNGLHRPEVNFACEIGAVLKCARPN